MLVSLACCFSLRFRFEAGYAFQSFAVFHGEILIAARRVANELCETSNLSFGRCTKPRSKKPWNIMRRSKALQLGILARIALLPLVEVVSCVLDFFTKQFAPQCGVARTAD